MKKLLAVMLLMFCVYCAHGLEQRSILCPCLSCVNGPSPSLSCLRCGEDLLCPDCGHVASEEEKRAQIEMYKFRRLCGKPYDSRKKVTPTERSRLLSFSEKEKERVQELLEQGNAREADDTCVAHWLSLISERWHEEAYQLRPIDLIWMGFDWAEPLVKLAWRQQGRIRKLEEQLALKEAREGGSEDSSEVNDVFYSS